MKKINEALGDPTSIRDEYVTKLGVALVDGDDTKAVNILQAKD